ncbi:MAG: alanine--tRNA ligase [Actinobacteria bacterium]|nr:alanine--tRNA ligase [Actinomycetota bacterium]
MTPLSGAEIRRAFLQYFKDRDHAIIPSASLIPVDPTLLLVNAGMVPFKRFFLGEDPAPYKRAASSQKVVRTVDIDIVGTTSRHATFFEMLGNFSFGDYFKELAIPLAYEFVTEHLGFDPDVLWYTIFEDDEEAAEIWIDGVGVPPDRVQRGGVEDGTFWQMGIPGPCGPSSEIFVDRGPSFGPGGGPIGAGEPGEHRFIELWNLVFMQNIQDEPYHVIADLPARNIDTGMGLERAAMLLQGVGSLFDCDLVRTVLATGERLTGTRYGDDDRSDVALRILADHGRAITFLISDGVVPSNEGRGYVLRRLIRRLVRHAWSLGARDLVTPDLIDSTIEVMGDGYPAIVSGRGGIVEMAEREEDRFRRTLDAGYQLIDGHFSEMGRGEALDGEAAFRLHDTYGFPIELTEEIAAERGMTVDRAGFDEEMAAQRVRARAARKAGIDAEAEPAYRSVYDRTGPTEFLGYEGTTATGRILSILREGEPVEAAAAGEDVEVFLDRTPFYAEAGGQVGDTGRIVTETGELRVTDTRFAVQGLNGHRARVASGTVRVGQHATAEVDPARRERIRKSHTGTHLLHWALRKVLGSHVQQAGSLVTDGRLRFDFSHYAGVEHDALAEVERMANERVIENAVVNSFEVSRQEAEDLGALAFFGDKYGDRVRVVQAGDFSRELCGGTHVGATGQVGPLVVVGESSIGSNLRRIEAFTGSTAYEHVGEMRRRLQDTAGVLRAQPDQVVEAARSLMQRVADQEELIEAFEAQARSGVAGELLGGAEEIGGARLLVAAVPGLAPDGLRALALQVRDRLGSGIAVLGAERDGKGGLIGVVTPDLIAEGISAGRLLAGPAGIMGGGGSRDPELAQAGGPHGDRLAEALASAVEAATTALRARS